MKITLTIPDASLPSWNTVMRMHYHAQHQVQQEWMALVLAVLPHDVCFAQPIDVCITSHKRGKQIDPDNLYVKGILDGLKSRLFPDDSPRWIDSVKLCSRQAKQERVEITVEAIA